MEAIDEEIHQLRKRVESLPPEAASEIEALRDRISQLETQVAGAMTAWDHVQLSRHEARPYSLDYIERIFDSFRELHGDRKYGDDSAIVGGMALFSDRPVMVIGQQKGRNTRERIYRNYGMPRPEGYRKAIRLMRLAEKFDKPIVTLIDTPGAYPGIGAEERGQAEAIAYNLRAMALLRVPVIAVVVGEGGSGGALAIGVADRVLMLEHSIYSVISPESCSAILWKNQDHAKEAADNLKLTAQHLLELGVVDAIVPEPPGGAQTDYDQAAKLLATHLSTHLEAVSAMDPVARLEARYARFRRIGAFQE